MSELFLYLIEQKLTKSPRWGFGWARRLYFRYGWRWAEWLGWSPNALTWRERRALKRLAKNWNVTE